MIYWVKRLQNSLNLLSFLYNIAYYGKHDIQFNQYYLLDDINLYLCRKWHLYTGTWGFFLLPCLPPQTHTSETKPTPLSPWIQVSAPNYASLKHQSQWMTSHSGTCRASNQQRIYSLTLLGLLKIDLHRIWISNKSCSAECTKSQPAFRQRTSEQYL